jgi:uncharacterized membrane protein
VPEDPALRRSRLRLAGFLSFMGVLHFAMPKPFDRIIPSWVPGRPRSWTYLSGAAELTSGLLLANRSTKRIGGAMGAATLVAVYPANVQMAIDNKPRTAFGVGMWLRLPMQFPMIGWALKHARR